MMLRVDVMFCESNGPTTNNNGRKGRQCWQDASLRDRQARSKLFN